MRVYSGRFTGLSSVAAELGMKQLQLLNEIVPKASRIAVVGNPINPATKLRMEAMQAAARASGIELLSIEVRNPTEHESAFSAMTQMHADALIDILGGADRSNAATTGRVLQLAMKHYLPAIYQSEDLVAEGGLMSYGPNMADEFGRAASYRGNARLTDAHSRRIAKKLLRISRWATMKRALREVGYDEMDVERVMGELMGTFKKSDEPGQAKWRENSCCGEGRRPMRCK
jgi:ABC-type uncharacterized transport system substrate-binding protein